MNNSIPHLPPVTVVMAVYNAEASVVRAIESIRNQKYSKWKLICVNDGSTDDSLSILKNYADKDSRITYIDKKNGGPASARAAAYAKVDTPYVISLDSDDYFSPDLLLKTVECAFRTQADSIAPNFISQHYDGRLSDWNKDNHLSPGQEMTGLEAFQRLFLCPSMHACNLWRTEIIKKCAISDEALYDSLNSDEYIQRLLFLNCRKVVIAEGGEYFYTYNSESITKKFTKKQLGYLTTCRKYIDLIDKYKLDLETAAMIKEYYFRLIIHLQIRLYESLGDLSTNDIDEIKTSLHEAYHDAIRYRKDVHFKDKHRGWIYRLSTMSGYRLFLLTCRLTAAKRSH